MSKMNAEKRNSRSRKLFDNWMRLVVSTWIKTRTYQIHLSAALFLTAYLSTGVLFVGNFV